MAAASVAVGGRVGSGLRRAFAARRSLVAGIGVGLAVLDVVVVGAVVV